MDRIGPQIKIANTLIEKEINNRFAELFKQYSLTGVQVSLLVYLYDSKGRTITQKEISDTFVLSHPTIRGIVKRLEENNFIFTSHLKNDQRQIVLTLSDRGYELLEQNINEIHAIMNSVNEQIVQGLTDVEAINLSKFLKTIIANFND